MENQENTVVEEKKEVNKENSDNSSKKKKIFKIIGDVVFAIFLLFILTFAVSNLRAKKTASGIPNIFGNGYLTVLTESMDGTKEFYQEHPEYKGTFKAGDLITVKLLKSDEEAKSLEAGSIITFLANEDIDGNGKLDDIVTHRIISVEEFYGTKYYRTRGDREDESA